MKVHEVSSTTCTLSPRAKMKALRIELLSYQRHNSPRPAEIYSQVLTFGCRKKKTAAVVLHLGSEFTTHLACSPVCVDS